MTQKLVEFVRRRDDLLFSFSGEMMDNVFVRLSSKEDWWHNGGVVSEEPEGFQFRDEMSPELRFTFSSEMVSEQLGLPPETLAIDVTIEDIALGARVAAANFRLDEILDEHKTVRIDLSSFDGLHFVRGFELSCFIHRVDDAPQRNGAWSKSHVLVGKSFIAKASEEEAYFDITWINFEDDDEKRDVWYYIDWTSLEVSEAPGSELFCVFANEDLRGQFKRLENNTHFGHLAIRQMVSDILFDIILVTLENANLSGDPQPESLHEQIQALLKVKRIEFSDLAMDYKQAEGIGKRDLEGKLKRIVQQIFEVGQELRGVQFGGYRAS